MYDLTQRNDLEDRIKESRANAPSDIFTKFARILVKFITSLLVVLTPVAKLTSASGGCLIVFTIGFLSFLFGLLWLPWFYFLISTSWLWLKAWYLRLILLIPGVIIAVAADIYVMFTPDFGRGVKQRKRAMCEEWPLSWCINNPPKQSVVRGL